MNAIELWKVDEDSFNIEQYPFSIQDVYGIMKDTMSLKDKFILNLDAYACANKVEEINSMIDVLVNSTFNSHVVIISSAYVSIGEFPKDKYYYDDIDKLTDEEKVGKEELPFDSVIERQCKLLEEAGFVNINNYCQLEYSEVFVYPNENGQKIIDWVNTHVENKGGC